VTHAAPADPVPSRTDPTVWRASKVIGGPWGRYAGASSWWTPLRALLLVASFTLLLGYGEKAPCADGSWTGNKQYTHACYSDVIPLWGAERLDVGAVPYRDNGVEYPVLTGGFMWATASLTRGLHAIFDTQSPGVLFAMITCFALAACGLLAVAGYDGSVRVWDCRSEKPVGALDPTTENCFVLAFNGSIHGATAYGDILAKPIAWAAATVTYATWSDIVVTVAIGGGLWFLERQKLLCFAAEMRFTAVVLLLLAVAMPHLLSGVFGADIRIPCLLAFLLVASSDVKWRNRRQARCMSWVPRLAASIPGSVSYFR